MRRVLVSAGVLLVIAAFVFIVVLLPTTLVLNWRLALPLLALCLVFTILTIIVMRRAETMQRALHSRTARGNLGLPSQSNGQLLDGGGG